MIRRTLAAFLRRAAEWVEPTVRQSAESPDREHVEPPHPWPRPTDGIANAEFVTLLKPVPPPGRIMTESGKVTPFSRKRARAG